MSQKSKNIAVFGGTFDPPHKGHSVLAEKILRDNHADEILFIPALNPPHKPGFPFSAFKERMEMVNLVVDKLNNQYGNHFTTSGIEGERTGLPSYTYETMVELENKYPDKTFILLLGEDSLLHLHTWYKGDKLIENWKIFTYPRRCFFGSEKEILEELKKKWPENIAYLLFESILPYELCNISSTEIRENLENQKDVSDWIYPEVYQYIKEKGLYQRD